MMEERLLCKDCKLNFEEKQKDNMINKIKDLSEIKHFIDDIEFYKKKYKDFLIKIRIKEVENFQLHLQNFKSEIMQQVNTLIYFSNQWIDDLFFLNQQCEEESFLNQLDKLIQQQNNKELNYELVILQKIEQINNQWKTKKLSAFQKCQEFIEDFSINPIHYFQQENFKSLPYISSYCPQLQSTQAILSDFIEDQQITAIQQTKSQYLLIQQNNKYKSIKQFCTFSFNKDDNLIIGGYSKVIKAFIFKKGQLKQIQILNGHEDYVRTLNFFKATSQTNFVSGSEDKSVRFWSINLLAKPKFIQKLNAHQNGILCLIINKKENLIITGSRDTTIKFWKRFLQNENQYLFWSQQQIIMNHSHNVYDLSLNQNEDKLISCSEDKKILVLSYQEKQWKIYQIITVQNFGYRLCFINNKLFTFQPRLGLTMHVYEMNQNKKYEHSFEIDVKGGNQECRIFFPQQYINQKNILINKNGFHINIIKVIITKEEIKKQKVYFKVEQSINYFKDSTGLIFGQLSEDGNYLITWDDKTKELQLRQLQYT
ncbi:unnamed protein product [Paramecium sonneborni]|uniref:WD40-repeat-containing domain n=1 Tax=Paramecium sonneborni TaxID=65129 RepID=A0A8S1QVC4_9CILI|nr:unnamed protein product [Paramecium sonneborni]